jgi:hypothetical protein
MSPDWLEQLAPAHAPPAIGWWPLAWGWWLLLALLLVLIAAAWAVRWYLKKHPRKTTEQRPSLRQLQQLALSQLDQIAQQDDDTELARELTHLLRRYAVSRFGRANVAELSGTAWLDFVILHGGTDLQGDSGRELLRAAYGGQYTAHRAAWLAAARDFVEAGT